MGTGLRHVVDELNIGKYEGYLFVAYSQPSRLLRFMTGNFAHVICWFPHQRKKTSHPKIRRHVFVGNLKGRIFR